MNREKIPLLFLLVIAAACLAVVAGMAFGSGALFAIGIGGALSGAFCLFVSMIVIEMLGP